jgi:hypothetical protein
MCKQNYNRSTFLHKLCASITQTVRTQNSQILPSFPWMMIAVQDGWHLFLDQWAFRTWSPCLSCFHEHSLHRWWLWSLFFSTIVSAWNWYRLLDTQDCYIVGPCYLRRHNWQIPSMHVHCFWPEPQDGCHP